MEQIKRNWLLKLKYDEDILGSIETTIREQVVKDKTEDEIKTYTNTLKRRFSEGGGSGFDYATYYTLREVKVFRISNKTTFKRQF